MKTGDSMRIGDATVSIRDIYGTNVKVAVKAPKQTKIKIER